MTRVKILKRRPGASKMALMDLQVRASCKASSILHRRKKIMMMSSGGKSRSCAMLVWRYDGVSREIVLLSCWRWEPPRLFEEQQRDTRDFKLASRGTSFSFCPWRFLIWKVGKGSFVLTCLMLSPFLLVSFSYGMCPTLKCLFFGPNHFRYSSMFLEGVHVESNWVAYSPWKRAVQRCIAIKGLRDATEKGSINIPSLRTSLAPLKIEHVYRRRRRGKKERTPLSLGAESNRRHPDIVFCLLF